MDSKNQNSSVNSWTTLDDQLLNETRVFDLRVRRMRPPDNSFEDDFFYIHSRDWVNIVPITPDKQVVLVEQFRHGIHRPSLETPGGIIDSTDLDPRATAVRELEEETGYRPREVISLGSIHPNPAMLNNTCHLFLALDVEKTGTQNLEPSEDITIQLRPLLEIPNLIRTGAISHALVASAFLMIWTQFPELVKQ